MESRSPRRVIVVESPVADVHPAAGTQASRADCASRRERPQSASGVSLRSMHMTEQRSSPGGRAGAGMAIGIAVGVAIGLAMKNIAVGIAIGVAIGAGLMAREKKKQD
ncbi:MAG TPA: hypothetical protein VM619_06230 [Luteimonas sp.]|nr:hypothetical protein [Luteimonas sp.]